jgi:hypothetical protein
MESSPSQSPRRRRPFFFAREGYACVLLGVVAAAGCTFVNSFGDVKQSPIGTDGGTDTFEETGPLPETGNDGDTAAPPQGLVVVGGVSNADGGTQQVLEVIDPATGNSLSREFMTVSAIVYDGDRDWWYVWENTAAGHFQPVPGDAVKMHVRKWDTTTSPPKWNNDKTYDVPAPIGQDTTVMTSEEPVYIAYKAGSTVTSFSYVIALIDAHDITDVSLIGSGTVDFTGTPLAALGSRGIGATSGGNFNVYERTPCDPAPATTCDLSVDHWNVPGGFAAPVDVGLSTVVKTTPAVTVANAGYGTWISNKEDLVSLTLPADTDGSLYDIQSNSPSTPPPHANKFTFSGSNRQFKSIAVDECDSLAFVPELLSEQIYFVPLPSSTVVTASPLSAGHPAQRSVWEPFTASLLAPFNQGGAFEITAFKIDIDGSHVPHANKRLADWAPPKDLGPQIVVTKIPVDSSYCGLR